MLESSVFRALRRWTRRWKYRLRVLGSFPTLWRGFCSDCGSWRWQAGNDEWYVFCMGCLTGYSRADLLVWGPGRDRINEGRQCTRDTQLGRLGRQLCKETAEEDHWVNDENSGEGNLGLRGDR